MKTAAKKPASAPSIFDRLSTEQQTQVYRLIDAGKFRDEDEVIETLAQAALAVFALDPLAEDAFYRVPEVVFGANTSTGMYILEVSGNEGRWAAEACTKKQRNAERSVAIKGKAA
jgi:hypothetical protein